MGDLTQAHESLGHLIIDEHPGLLADDAATAMFSPCRTYRYMLTRTWGAAAPAVFVMLNPSTADAFVPDPTVRRCQSFARAWGAGGLVVLNAFGLRSTDPAALRSHPDPVGPDNDAAIAAVLSWYDKCFVVVAWGVHATLGGRNRAVLELLRVKGVEPKCLAVTADGHPRHPLYLPKTSTPGPYVSP